jgi:lipopolysaccharide transport system ATP-binding protein
MKPIIEFQHVSKKFKIGAAQQPYLSIRDSITKLLDFKKSKTTEFYALNDVSFNVEQGDTVGIIGKNGAGKSTLLKVLSKITPPTSGQIITRGRIASLLEVGTGFHPELTGRDNVFMNGSILGMRKKEIEKNFDAIVDFAGIEKFIDTPLKHYSSGMQLRLAFAVAAFLENEILVIDEVLAVGDAEFQKKCLGKMDDVSKSGRTILFVSHNLSALQSLCKNAVILQDGMASPVIPSGEAISKYLDKSEFNKTENSHKQKNKKAYIDEVNIVNGNGEKVQRVNTYEDIYLDIKWTNVACNNVNVAIELHNYSGKAIMFSSDTSIDWYGGNKEKGKQYRSTVKIPKNWLKGDEYFIRPCLMTSAPIELIDIIKEGIHLSIIDPVDEHCIARGNFKELFEPFTHLTALDWKNEMI